MYLAVNTLMIGKPEKGKMVENMILQMAQMGQIVSKLDENELISLLERVNNQFGSKQKTTVKVCKFWRKFVYNRLLELLTTRHFLLQFDRRRAALDSDDEL